MFKKILLIFIFLLACGCNKENNNEIVNDFKNSIKKADTYTLKGNLELYSDEETYKYNIEVNYSKSNKYYVSMLNTSSDKEQIILKNSDGLYVITPSLNKSFKFDSNWPDNSSQVYILKSLLNDLDNDKNYTYDRNDNYIKCNVDYPNNTDLSYEKIYLNKNKISGVEVYNKEDTLKIKVEFKEYKLNTKINDNIYELKNYISKNECTEETCKEESAMSELEEAIYPLYIPSNTYLNNSEVVSSDDSNRVILTFSGENNFVLVEQPIEKNEEMEIIPVYGNPLLINDSIAAVTTNSIYWNSANVDYYLVSQDLSQEQMISVVASLGNTKSVLSTTK